VRKLEQRERVALGLADDPLDDALVQSSGEHGDQQLAGGLVAEPLE
jgi:hypothetical protein